MTKAPKARPPWKMTGERVPRAVARGKKFKSLEKVVGYELALKHWWDAEAANRTRSFFPTAALHRRYLREYNTVSVDAEYGEAAGEDDEGQSRGTSDHDDPTDDDELEEPAPPPVDIAAAEAYLVKLGVAEEKGWQARAARQDARDLEKDAAKAKEQAEQRAAEAAKAGDLAEMIALNVTIAHTLAEVLSDEAAQALAEAEACEPRPMATSVASSSTTTTTVDTTAVANDLTDPQESDTTKSPGKHL